jgi:hypothetical protein
MIPLQSDPVKWKKHLKLIEYGLRDYENLTSIMHRYSILSIPALYDAVKQEIMNDVQKSEKAFYIIILVKREQYYKLPNYRVFSMVDLDNFLPHIEERKHLYDELWYCRTLYNNDDNTTSMAGRMSFDYNNRVNIHTIEQVWNKSPRVIEEFNEESQFIFIRASRPSWGYRYNLEHIHIPDKFDVDTTIIKKQFSLATVELERFREKIEIFEEYLLGFGFKIFSIEYLFINGKINIIDWDTPNDRKVLR